MRSINLEEVLCAQAARRRAATTAEMARDGEGGEPPSPDARELKRRAVLERRAAREEEKRAALKAKAAARAERDRIAAEERDDLDEECLEAMEADEKREEEVMMMFMAAVGSFLKVTTSICLCYCRHSTPRARQRRRGISDGQRDEANRSCRKAWRFSLTQRRADVASLASPIERRHYDREVS